LGPKHCSLAELCVSSGLMFWKEAGSLANLGDRPHTQEEI